MAKYLWELDLESIPLGWDSIYKEALIKCPDGEIKIYPSELNGGEIKRYFYHPVKCREILLEEFKEYKSIALNIISQKEKLTLREFTSKIVQVDETLFQLLEYWCTDYYDIASMNPNDFIEYELDHEGYFSNRCITPAEKYFHLKLMFFSPE